MEHRLPALDGVRGLAILAVLVYHFVSLAAADAGGGPAFDSVFTKITGAGWVGVDLFFVLSGFLITGILYDTKMAGGGGFFRNFYARRCLRIFPAHYVYLALLFLLIPLLAPAAHAATSTLAQDRVWFATYLGNILPAIHGAKRPDFFVTGHLWSLAVEEQYYLVWPAVVLLLGGRRRLMMGCLAMIAGALTMRVTMTAAGVNGAASLTLAPARMDSLAIGALIALALRDPNDARSLQRWLPSLAVGAAVAVIGLSIREGRLAALDGPSYTVGYTLIAIVFGALLLKSLSARAGSRPGRLLSAPALQSAGKYSYAMYLVHLPIAWLLFQQTDLAASVPTLFGSHLPGELAFVAAAGAPTFALAWLSWRLLESPLLRLKALFPYAGAPKVETPPAPRSVPLVSEGPAG